jgi:hypothetical protein
VLFVRDGERLKGSQADAYAEFGVKMLPDEANGDLNALIAA